MKSEVVALLLVATLFNVGIAKAVRRLARNEPCQEPGFFPDTADCQKFYRCAEHPSSDGSVLLEKYEFQCPEGTIYDDSISTCNHVGSVENRPQDCVINPPPMGDEGEGDGQDSKSLKPIFLSYSTPVFSYIPISNYILKK